MHRLPAQPARQCSRQGCYLCCPLNQKKHSTDFRMSVFNITIHHIRHISGGGIYFIHQYLISLFILLQAKQQAAKSRRHIVAAAAQRRYAARKKEKMLSSQEEVEKLKAEMEQLRMRNQELAIQEQLLQVCIYKPSSSCIPWGSRSQRYALTFIEAVSLLFRILRTRDWRCTLCVSTVSCEFSTP